MLLPKLACGSAVLHKVAGHPVVLAARQALDSLAVVPAQECCAALADEPTSTIAKRSSNAIVTSAALP